MKGKPYTKLAQKNKIKDKAHAIKSKAVTQSKGLIEMTNFEHSIKPKMGIQYNTFRRWTELIPIPKGHALEIIIELDRPALPIKDIEERLKNAFPDYRKD